VVGRQTTVAMTRVEDSKILGMLNAPEGEVKVVKHEDDEIVRVYHSTESAEVAEYGYDNVVLTEDEAESLAQEYANGYIAGLEQ